MLYDPDLLLDEHVLRAPVRDLWWLERERTHARLAHWFNEHEQNFLRPFVFPCESEDVSTQSIHSTSAASAVRMEFVPEWYAFVYKVAMVS